jgi:hypothetical protein
MTRIGGMFALEMTPTADGEGIALIGYHKPGSDATVLLA